MRTALIMRIGVVLLAVIMCLPAAGAMRKRKIQKPKKPDTLAVVIPPAELSTSRKMSTSAFPVQINVNGRVVQIQSDCSQILPIYTNTGVLYLTTRLNKGTNWLGGLPRGQYFINNTPITIQ